MAELDGLPRRRWLSAPLSALLLPSGEAALEVLAGMSSGPLTCKWKVAATEDRLERQVLERLLQRLPPGARLRLDANGGWDRPTATAWAERLWEDPRLDWLEQPLDPQDRRGLADLLWRCPGLPVALDEALQADPRLRGSWAGWQVRRPAQEGDPRPLLAELEGGGPG